MKLFPNVQWANLCYAAHIKTGFHFLPNLNKHISRLMVATASVMLVCMVVYTMLLQIYLNVVIFTKNYYVLEEFAKSCLELNLSFKLEVFKLFCFATLFKTSPEAGLGNCLPCV